MSDAIERAARTLYIQHGGEEKEWDAGEALETYWGPDEYRADVRMVLDTALEPHWLAGEILLHTKKSRSTPPFPCTCGHPVWSVQHQAEALRAALLGGETDGR